MQFFSPSDDQLRSLFLSSDHRTHRTPRICGSLPPSQTTFIRWASCLWYGIFPSASLGYLSGSAPSQLFYTGSLAKHRKLKKGPWLLSNN